MVHHRFRVSSGRVTFSVQWMAQHFLFPLLFSSPHSRQTVNHATQSQPPPPTPARSYSSRPSSVEGSFGRETDPFQPSSFPRLFVCLIPSTILLPSSSSLPEVRPTTTTAFLPHTRRPLSLPQKSDGSPSPAGTLQPRSLP